MVPPYTIPQYLFSVNDFMQEYEGKFFEYKGYSLPMWNVILTGGGPETWEAIATGHMDQYQRYAPIEPQHRVMEIGCGVGRDAIELTERLDARGEYIGTDIIRPSIEWCRANISTKHINFQFYYFDVQSQIHNPGGTITTRDIVLPAANDSVDRIILQSVFTHMFEEDITHYMKEFARVLNAGGRVVASMFIMNDEAKKMLNEDHESGLPSNPHKPLTFEHFYGDQANGCYINDKQYPEGAVAFTPEALQRMLDASGLEVEGDIHYGAWCGREGKTDGQDMLVFKKRAA